MLPKPLFYTIALLFSIPVFAQPNLMVQKSGNSFFVQHKVEPKETWYSLGRLYNLSPRDIAPLNNTDITKGLSIGQLVKVPLVASNFSQNDRKSADEVLVPVYYQVKEGEWMFRISTNNNKVPIEQLEKWNKIDRNQVKAGMKLIVGHLKVKRDQSALATTDYTPRNENAVTTSPKAPVTPPRETKEIVSVDTDKKQPVSNPEPAPVLKREDNSGGAAIDFNGGYFRRQYEGGSKSTQGAANIFRSTSGWKDGKYYALMDNVAVGTIVLVTNRTTNRSVYAKVLGNLSDIKENAGLIIRISNAAAAELGSGESRFTAEVKY